MLEYIKVWLQGWLWLIVILMAGLAFCFGVTDLSGEISTLRRVVLIILSIFFFALALAMKIYFFNKPKE